MHSHQLINENVVDDICVSNQLKPLKPRQDHDSPERGGLLGSVPSRSIAVKSASHETAHWRGKGARLHAGVGGLQLLSSSLGPLQLLRHRRAAQVRRFLRALREEQLRERQSPYPPRPAGHGRRMQWECPAVTSHLLHGLKRSNPEGHLSCQRTGGARDACGDNVWRWNSWEHCARLLHFPKPYFLNPPPAFPKE